MARFVPLLLATLLLAGCSTPHRSHADPALVQATANTKADRWTPGDWWSYHATINGNKSFDVDLVVDRARSNGFFLGTNRSNGFFGLPFTGNVTRELNPRIGEEEWPMYRFPLTDGQEWSYHLWGHDGKTMAHATIVDVPGHGPEPGFRFEATSLGQTFARYDYAPSVGWFTHLELIDPAKRATVLEADLRGYGANYRGLYFVEETLAVARLEQPSTTLPAALAVDVPATDGPARAHLAIAWTAGACDATLYDESHAPLLHASVTGTGAGSDQGEAPPGAARAWSLDATKCVGSGSVYLVVTGVRSREGLVKVA